MACAERCLASCIPLHWRGVIRGGGEEEEEEEVSLSPPLFLFLFLFLFLPFSIISLLLRALADARARRALLVERDRWEVEGETAEEGRTHMLSPSPPSPPSPSSLSSSSSSPVLVAAVVLVFVFDLMPSLLSPRQRERRSPCTISAAARLSRRKMSPMQRA